MIWVASNCAPARQAGLFFLFIITFFLFIITFWVVANCAPARQAFVASLMQHIAVDSYGKCLHNAEFPAHEERVFGAPTLPLLFMYSYIYVFMYLYIFIIIIIIYICINVCM